MVVGRGRKGGWERTAAHWSSLLPEGNDVSGSKENSFAHFFFLEILPNQLLGLRAPAVTLHAEMIIHWFISALHLPSISQDSEESSGNCIVGLRRK